MPGWPRANRADEREFLARPYADLPELGMLTGRGSEADLERVLARIADLARAGQTAGGHAVILSTHDPDQAFALDARVILMHEGAILADGAPDQVLTPARLSEVYGVPVAVERTETGRTVCAPSLLRTAPDR